MKLRTSALNIAADKPYENDCLNRQPFVDFIKSIVTNLSDHASISIDGAWGSGKTTLVKFLQPTLEQAGHTTLYFNAWDTDHADDPIIPLVATLGDAIKKNTAASKKAWKKTKSLAVHVAKRSVPFAIKLATSGVIDIEKSLENETEKLAEGLGEDLVETYLSEKEKREELRISLQEFVAERTKEPNAKVVFFIDELDRCRPTYAISVLERIKHLMDVEGLIFIFSIDQQQLQSVIRHVYGTDFDAKEYLRRFFHLQLVLTQPTLEKYCDRLFQQYDWNTFFYDRSHPSLSGEKDELASTCKSLAQLFKLNLRALEQCYARIRIAAIFTKNDQYFFPNLLATLVFIREGLPLQYHRFISGDLDLEDLIKALRTLPGSDTFYKSYGSSFIESLLFFATQNRKSTESLIRDFQHEIEAYQNTLRANPDHVDKHVEHISQVLDLLKNRYSMRNGVSTSLIHIAQKIELVYQQTDN